MTLNNYWRLQSAINMLFGTFRCHLSHHTSVEVHFTSQTVVSKFFAKYLEIHESTLNFKQKKMKKSILRRAIDFKVPKTSSWTKNTPRKHSFRFVSTFYNFKKSWFFMIFHDLSCYLTNFGNTVCALKWTSTDISCLKWHLYVTNNMFIALVSHQ